MNTSRLNPRVLITRGSAPSLTEQYGNTNMDTAAEIKDIPHYKQSRTRALSIGRPITSHAFHVGEAAMGAAHPIEPPSMNLQNLNISGNTRSYSPLGYQTLETLLTENLSRENHYRVQQDHDDQTNSSVHSQTTRHDRDDSETSSYETNATSLPGLQSRAVDEFDFMEPLDDDDDADRQSFILVAPADEGPKQYSLETRSEQLFSTEHLRLLFEDTSQLLHFTAFLSANRPASVPVLVFYLDAIKALKAISYANAIAEALEPIKGYEFTAEPVQPTKNSMLTDRANRAFKVLVDEDLPAYVTHTYIQTVSLSITRRITGTLPVHLREASEGLAEVFCLTDPSRQDNPIVFASEEFHRTTQYGMGYVIGRNCRFLQGPKTNPHSVRRLRETTLAGKEHCEVFLNYRRDGSPFMNLLMVAPLCDSRGKVRYNIGAQVDVSGLVKECSDFESLKRLVISAEKGKDGRAHEYDEGKKDEFQELSEMFNEQELETVRRHGGRLHKEAQEGIIHDSNGAIDTSNRPRLVLHDNSPDGPKMMHQSLPRLGGGKLSGVYENYLLVRPYPSLRILFASPSLRVPGILQSPFMGKIGGSARVREELTQALANGRGVTAKVRWVTKFDDEGRSRWIHCTPLIGSNGAIGVWMVVIVDDEKHMPLRNFKNAPQIDPAYGRQSRSKESDRGSFSDNSLYGLDVGSLRERSGTSHTNRTHRTDVRSYTPDTMNLE